MLRAILVIIAAVLIEIFYFNFQAVAEHLSNSVIRNMIYTSSDVELNHFSEELVSQTDPMIFISDIDAYVNDISIKITTNPEVTQGSMFVMADKDSAPSEENMYTLDRPLDQPNTYQLNRFVHNLRIDPGEAEGVKLMDVQIIVNPVTPFHFSIAHVIAILMIYYGFSMLFMLQRSPSYGIKNANIRK